MFRNKSLKQYETFIKVALIIISASLLIYFCLQNYQYFFNLLNEIIGILEPILYGLILAYLAVPICTKLDEMFRKLFEGRLKPEIVKKLSKGLSVFLSISFLLLIILAMIMLIIPQLVASISNFIEKYPQYIIHSEQRVNEFIGKFSPETREMLANNWHEITNYINQFFSNTILPNLTSMVNDFSFRIIGIAKSIFSFLIGFIVAVYCLDKRKVFSLQAKKITFALFRENVAKSIIRHTRQTNQVFLGFLIGKIIDSIIIGIICFFGVTLLRIPYSLLISVIIGVTNIIPFFGPFLGAVPCTILIILEDPIKALYFLIFIFILQQFDGNILGPKILGDTTGISSFWVLFSILLFGGLWGVLGMIIAVPLFVVIYNLIKELVNEKLTKRGLPTLAYEYEDINNLKSNEENKKASADIE